MITRAAAAQAQTPAVGLDVIQKYAPTLHLHPYDNVLKNGLTAADLAAYSSATNYLRFTNNVFPTSGNDFEAGDPIVPGLASLMQP